jgi:hypothetical protein
MMVELAIVQERVTRYEKQLSALQRTKAKAMASEVMAQEALQEMTKRFKRADRLRLAGAQLLAKEAAAHATEKMQLQSQLTDLSWDIKQQRLDNAFLQADNDKLRDKVVFLQKVEKKDALCSVCYDRALDCRFDLLFPVPVVQTFSAFFCSLQCGHVFCEPCAIAFKECPVCRALVQQRTKLFFS